MISLMILYSDVIIGAMASQITSLPIVNQPFIQAQVKENIKARGHWPLCGEFTVTGEFPAQMSSNAENVSVWLCHHEVGWLYVCRCSGLWRCQDISRHVVICSWQILNCHGCKCKFLSYLSGESISRNKVKRKCDCGCDQINSVWTKRVNQFNWK